MSFQIHLQTLVVAQRLCQGLRAKIFDAVVGQVEVSERQTTSQFGNTNSADRANVVVVEYQRHEAWMAFQRLDEHPCTL